MTIRWALFMAIAIITPVAARGEPSVAPLSAVQADVLRHEPHWVQAPGGDDVAKVYPSHAARAGISGRAEMKCFIERDGHLRDCSVVKEAPEDEGFGAAILKLAHLFRMGWKNGPPAPAPDGSEGTVQVPVQFRLSPQ